MIWDAMTAEKEVGSPVPVNRAPLEASEMVSATARGIFAVSPPGTGVRVLPLFFDELHKPKLHLLITPPQTDQDLRPPVRTLPA